MSRVPYPLTAIRSDDDSSGKNIVPYASVSVVDANGNPAQIYLQETGGSPSSYFALNENGFKQIWAEPGRYTITIDGGETYDIFLTGELSDRVQSVATIADLRARTDSSDGQLYNVVGAGTWRYDASSTAVIDEKNGIIQPDSIPGRFIYDGDIYNLSNSTAYGEDKKIKTWGAGSISDDSELVMFNNAVYKYIGSSFPKSITGNFASEPAVWVRVGGHITQNARPATKLADITAKIRSGYNVVITGDSLSFNAYQFPTSDAKLPTNYAYKNPYGLASWGHLIRDSILSAGPDFTLAKNAQISFTRGVTKYANVNAAYTAGFNNQMETFLVASANDEIVIRTNGVFNGATNVRLMFFTGRAAAFPEIASFDVYTNGVLRRSVDLRGDVNTYYGRYQLNVDNIPMDGTSEIVLKNIVRASGLSGPAAVQFVGYTTTCPNVYMTGHGGWTSAQVLADYENMVGQYDPELVFYMIGANDQAMSTGITPAMFLENVESFITQTRAAKPNSDIVLLSTTPTDNYPNRYARPSGYIDALYQLSVKHNCFFVDCYEVFANSDPAAWRFDNVHMTIRGNNFLYRYVKDKVFPTLVVGDGFTPDASYQIIPTVTSPVGKSKQVVVQFDGSGDPIVGIESTRIISVTVSEAGLVTVSPSGDVRIANVEFVVAPAAPQFFLPMLASIGASGSLSYHVRNMLTSGTISVNSKATLAGAYMLVTVL